MGKRAYRNPDHIRRRNMPAPKSEEFEAHLQELLRPTVYSQLNSYRQLGLRERILSLPLMVAAVLTLLWRQVPSVHELTRLLNREDLLWAKATKVSQQALDKRLLSFPAVLFEQVLMQLLGLLQQRWQGRERRPLPTSLAWSRKHFGQLWVVDSSTLETLFRKLESLQDEPARLAGKLYTVVDLVTHLPVQIWLEENPFLNDTVVWQQLVALSCPGTLWIFDRGFYDFAQFAALVKREAAWLTRLKQNASYRTLNTLTSTPNLKDQIICLGHGRQKSPTYTVRLVEVRHGQTWYRYITSVLSPQTLPPYVIADLYNRRWHIETAFGLVKRLLGLSYLWTGSFNGVKLQVWATWLFYIVLLDLADAVADELSLPTERISVEMLFRGLYHFTVAASKGNATDPIAYFTAPENKDLGIVKRLPKAKQKQRLDLSPHPT
jgi:hypothetical protein